MLFIFDMGGVVTNTFEFDAMYKSLKMDSKKFREICKSGTDIFSLLTKGEISVKEFWAQFNERIKGRDIAPVKNDLFRLYFHPVLNEKTAAIIKSQKNIASSAEQTQSKATMKTTQNEATTHFLTRLMHQIKSAKKNRMKTFSA